MTTPAKRKRGRPRKARPLVEVFAGCAPPPTNPDGLGLELKAWAAQRLAVLANAEMEGKGPSREDSQRVRVSLMAILRSGSDALVLAELRRFLAERKLPKKPAPPVGPVMEDVDVAAEAGRRPPLRG